MSATGSVSLHLLQEGLFKQLMRRLSNIRPVQNRQGPTPGRKRTLTFAKEAGTGSDVVGAVVFSMETPPDAQEQSFENTGRLLLV